MKRCYSDPDAIVTSTVCLTVYRDLSPSPRGDPTTTSVALSLMVVATAVVLLRKFNERRTQQ